MSAPSEDDLRAAWVAWSAGERTPRVSQAEAEEEFRCSMHAITCAAYSEGFDAGTRIYAGDYTAVPYDEATSGSG